MLKLYLCYVNFGFTISLVIQTVVCNVAYDFFDTIRLDINVLYIFLKGCLVPKVFCFAQHQQLL